MYHSVGLTGAMSLMAALSFDVNVARSPGSLGPSRKSAAVTGGKAESATGGPAVPASAPSLAVGRLTLQRSILSPPLPKAWLTAKSTSPCKPSPCRCIVVAPAGRGTSSGVSRGCAVISSAQMRPGGIVDAEAPCTSAVVNSCERASSSPMRTTGGSPSRRTPSSAPTGPARREHSRSKRDRVGGAGRSSASRRLTRSQLRISLSRSATASRTISTAAEERRDMRWDGKVQGSGS
mmetsp:Transcript_9103/g.27241  ORF Transcript_9103/g.27241 Transcript_9103/m.27241 type:complete len:235 (+) Transcript_9103:1219-1923(+)